MRFRASTLPPAALQAAMIASPLASSSAVRVEETVTTAIPGSSIAEVSRPSS
jgi:hypothetical protein